MSEYDHATQLALDRFGVIAPVVSRKLTRREYNAELGRIAACLHHFHNEEGGVVEKSVSRRNVRRWVQWHREGRDLVDGRKMPPGLDALRPIERADKGMPRVISEDVIHDAIRLRKEEPRRNTAALVELIQSAAVEEGQPEPHIQEATLAYHLRAQGATRKQLKQEGRVFPRFEHAHRNDCWQGDMTGGFWLPNPLNPKEPRQCYLHALIDDRSRYVPHGEFYFRQNLTCHLDCFRKAVIGGGKPSLFYCDHGSAYQARQARLMAARLGIQVVFATPYHPQGKGKIERFWRTVKESFYPEARHADLKTLEELNQFWWGWLERYHDTHHSEIDATPRQQWEAEAALATWPEPAVLAEAFLWEESRPVDRAGCIDLEGNSYPVPEHLVCQTVSIRFDPFDLSSIRIYHQGSYIDTVTPQELKSNTFRKALPRRTEKPLPLESSVTLRKQLSSAYRARTHQAFGQTSPSDRGTDCLTRVEFVTLLSERLEGRTLTPVEMNMAIDFFLRYAPLQAHRVDVALLAAIEEKGAHRHLRFYLDAVKAARMGTKEGR